MHSNNIFEDEPVMVEQPWGNSPSTPPSAPPTTPVCRTETSQRPFIFIPHPPPLPALPPSEQRSKKALNKVLLATCRYKKLGRLHLENVKEQECKRKADKKQKTRKRLFKNRIINLQYLLRGNRHPEEVEEDELETYGSIIEKYCSGVKRDFEFYTKLHGDLLKRIEMDVSKILKLIFNPRCPSGLFRLMMLPFIVLYLVLVIFVTQPLRKIAQNRLSTRQMCSTDHKSINWFDKTSNSYQSYSCGEGLCMDHKNTVECMPVVFHDDKNMHKCREGEYRVKGLSQDRCFMGKWVPSKPSI